MEDGDSNLYLAIATGQTSSTGVIDIWRWMGEPQGFELDHESSNMGKNLNPFVITDLKYSKAMHSIIVTNSGSQDLGYSQYTYAFKRSTENRKFNTTPSLYFLTLNAHSVELFNDTVIVIDTQTYLIRYDSTTAGSKNGVHVLRARVDFE